MVGRCSDSAHCVLGYLDPNAGIARIIVKNPELPGGWLVVGRSDELIELPVLSEQVELNAEDEEVLGPLETTMELELDGQTLRLWLGSGEQRRLIATGLDAFVLDESSGDLENVSARLGQPLTSAGPAGVYARRQPAHFDDFELLPY